MRYQLIIFDCDGVLVDSETIANRVLVEQLSELGLVVTLEEALARFKGCKMADCVSAIEQQLGYSLPVDFVPQLRSQMAEAFREQIQPVEGIEFALDNINLPYCVASSGPMEKIRLTLELTGLLSRFEGRIFSAYEIGSWKPAPDLFLHAASCLGVKPDRCAVIEDSVLGVRAGVAAGMKVFGYSDATDGLVLEAEGAYVFSNMKELPLLIANQ